jgi:hypothetical protein
MFAVILEFFFPDRTHIFELCTSTDALAICILAFDLHTYGGVVVIEDDFDTSLDDLEFLLEFINLLLFFLDDAL